MHMLSGIVLQHFEEVNGSDLVVIIGRIKSWRSKENKNKMREKWIANKESRLVIDLTPEKSQAKSPYLLDIEPISHLN